MSDSSSNSESQSRGGKKESIDFSDIAGNLTADKDGTWFSGDVATCSYPEDGQDRYFAIEEESFWFRHRNNAIVAAVGSFAPDGFILDVGGANGYVTLGLEKAGFEAILLEPSTAGVQNARARGLRSIICSTVADAGFKDRVVPAIGLFDVLEHIEDEMDFLKELNRILVPKGRLYLTVPAYKALWSAEDEYAEHFRRYTIGRLKKTLKNSGFITDYATYLFSYLPIPLFFSRTLPTKLGLAKPSTDEGALQENMVKSKLTNGILSVFHRIEVQMIRRKVPTLFGGSVLIVAHAEAAEDKS